jgi:hypothetical protein
MIRQAVMLGVMEVDILEWDGNEEELKAFGPDKFYGVNLTGVAEMGSAHPAGRRILRPGDILVRPAGRADLSPLMFYSDTWWAPALGLL